jgi:hypothetical protein
MTWHHGGLWVGVRQAASVFERVVLTGAQMSGDVARQPRCGRVELGWGRQKKGGGLACRHPASLPASFVLVVVMLRLSFVTWRSRAAGLSSASAGEEGGAVLTLHPGGVASGRDVRTAAGRSGGGGGKEGSDVATVGGRFQIWAWAGRWTAG